MAGSGRHDLGTQKVIPTPDFRILPRVEESTEKQDNEESPRGSNRGMGISFRLLVTGKLGCALRRLEPGGRVIYYTTL